MVPNVDPNHLLIQDAELLMRQYEIRNEANRALSAEQRKVWASEMVAVMAELVKAVKVANPNSSVYSIETVASWNAAMNENRRLATFKIPSGRT